jgi:hypothetical protein
MNRIVLVVLVSLFLLLLGAAVYEQMDPQDAQSGRIAQQILTSEIHPGMSTTDVIADMKPACLIATEDKANRWLSLQTDVSNEKNRFVSSHFGVVFKFDTHGRLVSYSVETYTTGP